MKNIIFLTIILFVSGCNIHDNNINNEMKLVEIKYPNGNIEKIGATLNGKRIGLWIYYDSLKNIDMEVVYYDDSLNGPIRFYNENGTIGREGQIKNDTIFYGLWRNYYCNGQLEAQGKYIDGQMDSIWDSYFEDGSIERKIEYRKNKVIKVLYESENALPILF